MASNKYKYLDADGKHSTRGPATGWVYSDAVRKSKCPKCGSDHGYHCETPKGRKVWPPHAERVLVVLGKGDHSHCCRRCGHAYTPADAESEDCPKCGHNGVE